MKLSFLEECTNQKSNNHASKNHTHVTIGLIIVKYVKRLSVHYPLPLNLKQCCICCYVVSFPDCIFRFYLWWWFSAITNKNGKSISGLGTILAAMWSLVTYSNYFKIVSTATFLVSRSRLISGMFLFKIISLLYIYIRYK